MNIVIEKGVGDCYWPADENMAAAFMHFADGLNAISDERIQRFTDIAALHGCTVTIKGA